MRTRLRIDIAAIRRIREAALDGLTDGGEFILDESQREAPFDEGTLAGSGTVTVDDGPGEVAISYDTPYAVRQHEDLTLRHAGGRKAKFLEDPLRANGPEAFKRAGEAVRRVTG